MILPNADRAFIPIEKLKGYALNLTHEKGMHKAIVFDEVLGYNTGNFEMLISRIQEGIYKFPATFKGHTAYGDRYEIIMHIEGANGRTAKVVTGWIIDEETGFPRLTTAYIPKKVKKSL